MLSSVVSKAELMSREMRSVSWSVKRCDDGDRQIDFLIEGRT